MLLSVIIATHKRAPILKQCLQHLAQQTIADQLEVIVVSDGHDPSTAELFSQEAIANAQLAMSFHEIEKSQQGVARNYGLQHASADLVMFINDDIFLEPNACELHVHALQAQEPVNQLTSKPVNCTAVLGYTTWDSAIEITPVMHWLEQSGWQFGYPHIAQYAHNLIPQTIQHQYTYSSHISLPTEVANAHLFREDVELYGWEDIEWGMRLRDSGVGLYYEPDAKGLHHHRITLEDSLKRLETVGKAAKIMKEKFPEFDRVPIGWKRITYHIAALLPTMAGKHRKAFLEGLMS